METISKNIHDKFIKMFNREPQMFRSPGRINLLGEHTDYNNGFVLPAAIDKAIILAITPSADYSSHIYAVDFNDYYEFDLKEIEKSENGWPNYISGVVDQFSKNGLEIAGFDCVFGGNIPIAAGLSSSAALECGIAFALDSVFDLNLDKLELVRMSQKAENEFVGVQCGIMDQFINMYGQQHKVLKLDCRSLDYEYFPFNSRNTRIILCDTRIKRELAVSEYNLRRAQCEQGVKSLQQYNNHISSLRDLNVDFLQKHETDLDNTIYRRCRYVVTENARVLNSCIDLQRDDLIEFGKKMYASHDGLRNEYEVSCQELDILVEIAKNIDGVFGSRMMGAGFGGCTINLVEQQSVEDFKNIIGEKYKSKTGKDLKIYTCNISSGTAKYSYKVTEV